MAYNMLVSDGNYPMGKIYRFYNHGNSNPVNYTWETWFRPDNLTKQFVIMGFPSDDVNSVRLGCVPNQWGSGAHFYVELNGTSHVYKNISILNTGKWYHEALVHEDLGRGNGEFRLYVFGREYKLFATNDHSMITNSYMDFGGLLIQGFMEQIESVMEGAIDEVRIWQEARSQQQIQDQMSARISTADAVTLNNRLLAYINFDGSTNNNGLKDVTGNGNDLHPEDTATTSPTGNIERKDSFDTNVMVGGPKHALSFPGKADCYVSIPASSTLNDFLELTVEVWVKPDANLANGTYTIIHQENAFWLGIQVIQFRGRHSANFIYIINTRGKNNTGSKVKTLRAELGEWQHVAIAGNIYDSDNDGTADQVFHTCAVNGTLDYDPQPINDSEVLDPDSHELTIGVSQNDRGGEFKPFQGLLSEVRIWRKDLSLGINPDGSGDNVLEVDDYRWKELPYEAQVDPNAVGIQRVVQELSCHSPKLMAYYKFDHGEAGKDNTKPQRVNWLRDHSLNRNHGRLSTGFALMGNVSNWVEADIKDESGKTFEVRTTYGNSNVVPEPGLLLQAPKLYHAETHPRQSVQKTDKAFGKDWDNIAGLYLLVSVKTNDVLVITLNGRRLRNKGDNAGVALGVAIEGNVDHRSGIFYERGGAPAKEELGGMSMQYVYVVPHSDDVPDDMQRLLEVRGMFATYGDGAKALIEQGGKSALDVMAYSQR